MRKVVVGLLGAAMVSSVGIMLPAAATAAPPVDPAPATASKKAPVDELPNPFEDKRRELREEAVNGVLKGDGQDRSSATAAPSRRSARPRHGGGTQPPRGPASRTSTSSSAASGPTRSS